MEEVKEKKVVVVDILTDYEDELSDMSDMDYIGYIQ